MGNVIKTLADRFRYLFDPMYRESGSGLSSAEAEEIRQKYYSGNKNIRDINKTDQKKDK